MNWNNLPPLTALRAFAAYAQTGSVEAAGQALNVTHAAISQQMRQLEAHMGVVLLDRSGRSLALTPEGRTLADALRDGFGQIIQSVESLTGTDADRPLLLSTTPTFAASWLMPRLGRFREQHPDISLMVDPSAAVSALEPGGIDVALRYGNGNWPGLEAELLVKSAVVVVAAPHLVESKTIQTPSDLRDFHWLQEFGTTEATDWLSEHGVTSAPGRAITALPGNMMIEAVRQGQGVASLAGVFVEDDIRAGRLKVLFKDTRKSGYHLVTRPGVQRPPLRAFTRWIRREAARPTETPTLPPRKT
ncbi:LysR family transcriptional regulator [Pacificoceanicola onchidii]|uniref:LysR family transcriptional regulator n=1 Tax=Pacificoceanicola onchidii TaxID=2562685 RepID=UPI0010A5CBC0|nr:LysR family transcriptional regulator [Pacificoceanicola onchidii]